VLEKGSADGLFKKNSMQFIESGDQAPLCHLGSPGFVLDANAMEHIIFWEPSL